MIVQVPRFLSALACASALLVVAPLSQAQSSMCAAVSNNPLVMENLCSEPPKAAPLPAATSTSSRTSAPLLTLTAQQVSEIQLDDPPLIRPGDVLTFEANRGDFILHLYLSNGKMIVTQPLTREEAANTTVAWRKGRARLDYPETVNQYLVAFRLIPLHEREATLLLRGIRIDRNGRTMLELERNQPGKKPVTPEPPMSYPQDSGVMVANVTMPTLFSPKPETGYRAIHIPAFSAPPMMMQSAGTTAGDPNHFKYAGQELDAESGLYHMGARYYSPALGRFMSPDPLYIELHRLADPQQLNLYAYGRNNPVRFSDPSGLDIKFNCDNKANCATAVGDLNKRENAQFNVTQGKNGKLTIDGKVDPNKLSKAERALYNAVTDTHSHATVNILGSTGQADFGIHNGPGNNTVDLGNVGQLNAPSNAGGINAGDVIAHESLESFFSLSNEDTAHSMASQFFPGLGLPTDVHTQFDSLRTEALGQTFVQAIADGRGSERTSIQFLSPIPAIDIATGHGQQAAQDAGAKVTGVTFVPKQQ